VLWNGRATETRGIWPLWRIAIRIMYLRGLHSLDLSDNLLEGGNPEETANLYDLRVINLKNNRFTGKLQVDIGGHIYYIVVSANEELTLINGLGKCHSKGNSTHFNIHLSPSHVIIKYS